MAGTKVIQASVTTPDNFNEIIKIRSLILYVTVVQDFEREKKKKKKSDARTDKAVDSPSACKPKNTCT